MPCFCCRVALRFSSPPEAKPEWRQSEGRAKAERRQNEGTLGRREPKSCSPLRYRNNSQDCCFTSRPFSNAKIVRNNDMANFFKQKMSLFPLLEKRGSLRGQKRLSFATGKEVSRVTKRGFSQLSWANCGLLARGTLVHNSKVCKLRNIIRFPRCFFLQKLFPHNWEKWRILSRTHVQKMIAQIVWGHSVGNGERG